MQPTGYIKIRVEDALFMIESGRQVSALVLLLTAIDASAVKVFPEGTSSLYAGNTHKKMGNAERYKRFLRVRLREVMFGALPEGSYFKELKPIANTGNSPEETIYKALRCNDVHEGYVPPEFHYIYNENSVSENISLTFTGEDDVVFSNGFLTLLIKVVVDAPCNAEEFGRISYRRNYKGYSGEEDYLEAKLKEFNITKGRILIYITLVERLKSMNEGIHDDELMALVVDYIEQECNHPSFNVSGIYNEDSLEFFEPMRDRSGKITPTGKSCLAAILHEIEFVNI